MKRHLGEKGRKQGGGSKYKEGVAEEQEREAAFQKRGIKITSRHKWCYFWLHNLKIYLEIGERDSLVKQKGFGAGNFIWQGER